MNIGLLLVIVLILLLVGAFPHFGFAYNAHWGYQPVSVLGIVLIVVVILVLTGRI